MAEAKKGKKKAAKYTTEVLWTVRLEQAWGWIKSHSVEVIRGLKSPDRPTRRAAAVFLASLVGLGLVFVLSVTRWWTLHYSQQMEHQQSESAKKMGDFLRKQSDEAKAKFAVLTIGQFTVELRDVTENPAKPPPGVVNMAEIEVVVECDTRETRIFMEDRLDEVKNQITNVLTALDREELMSREGKRRIKKRLMEKINIWLPKGKVEDLYFSKLVVG